MPTLVELEAKFMFETEQYDTWTEVDRDPLPGESIENVPKHQVSGMREIAVPVSVLAQANSVSFVCPKCFTDGGGTCRCVHRVRATFAGRGVPDHIGSHNKEDKPVRWNVSGTDMATLSLTPSIQVEGGCVWHGFVTNGSAA